MKQRMSLETDLDSHRPSQDILPGLGLGKSSIFFIFSYVILANILKQGIGGLETVFIGVVVIGTFYIFLRKYDSDEMEAHIAYFLSSLNFRLFSKGIKKLNAIKNVREDYFVLQNGGLRAVLEVYSRIELSNEPYERIDQFIRAYSGLLETFNQYFQIVVRIRKISPEEIVTKNLGTTETPTAKKYLELLTKKGVTAIKTYIILTEDLPKWFYFDKKNEITLRNNLQDQLSSCVSILTRSELINRIEQLKGSKLLNFIYDDNFFQNNSPQED
ncbi:MAG TPA: hypothetical protein ENH13_01060 [Euryarchaeota archaeon]|nr:hypothetical protein [Euryarchaeota archaeon]